MANDYRGLLDQTPETIRNPYVDLLEADDEEESRRLRGTLTGAVTVAPDKFAAQKQVARYLGYPTSVVEALPDTANAAKVQSIDEKTVDAPATRRKFTDEDFAKLAHDDTDNLTSFERVLRGMRGAKDYLTGLGTDGKASLAGDVSAGVWRANRGAAGVFQAGTEVAAPLFDPLAGTILPENPIRRMADFFAQAGKLSEEKAKQVSPAPGGIVHGGVSSGVQSLTQNVLTLPITLMNPGVGLSAMAGVTGGQGFQEAREKGLSTAQSLVFGASQAIVEYATEKIPVQKLIGDIAKDAGVVKTIVNQLAAEIPGEQVATLLQDLNEWAVLHPDKPFADYIQERPSAAAQTLIATLVGVGGNVMLAKGIDRAVTTLQERAERAARAEEQAQRLEQLDQLAAASKVRQRDPDTFEDFVRSAAEDGPVTHVYVDAQTLAQSANVEALAAVSPSIAAQLPQALATGGTVQIPVEEYATHIAGTELNQGLIDELRTEPDGFSRREAQEFMQSQAEDLRAEVERVVAQKADDDTFKASIAQVKEQIKAQLDATSRFKPEVHDAYATMMSHFFGVMGAKVGMSPEALLAQYPIKIGAESVGGRQLDQKGGVAFTDETTAAYSGQTNHTLTATLPDGKTGTLEYTVYDGKPQISMIDVPTASRRRGIGRALVQELQRKFPNTEIDWGGLTPDGAALRASLGFREAPTEAAPLIRELADVRATMAMLEEKANAGALTPEEAQEWNGLRDREFELETQIGNDTGVKRLIDTGELNQSPYTGDTIEVDGQPRPTTNSNGQRIAETEEGLRNFWRWFGDSKVVDKDGKPLVVYHSGMFDENDDPVPVVGAEGFHFGTKTAAEMRDVGKRVDDFIRGIQVSEDENEDGGTRWYWSADGIDSYDLDPDGFDSEEGARRDAEQFAVDQNFDDADPMPLTAAYLSISNPASTPDQKNDWTAAVERAKADGNDGIRYRNQFEDKGSTSWVAFQPEQIKSAVGNRGTFDPADANILNQRQAQGNRGSFRPSDLTITLLKGADLSTFLHESGHFFLEVQFDLASRIGAKDAASLPPGERELLADTSALLKWFGVPDLPTWYNLDFEEQRSYHERFARGFESYLFEGKAPSIELHGLFQRFRAWLLNIYRELKNLNVEISDEVRGVFDRMLATNEQIKLAEQARSMLPLFTSPDQAGMTVEEFAAYQALGTQATADAIEDLQSRGLRDMRYLHNARGRVIKRLQKQAEDLRREIRAEVRLDVLSQPVYRAWTFLTTRDEDGGKLSRDALVDMYGGDGDRYALLDWKRLTDLRMTAAEGLHPDMVADMFGFSSGDELVRAILDATPINEEIEGLTDSRMLQEHGELSSPDAIEREADRAVHNDVRARMVATEANALAKAVSASEKVGTDKRGRPVMRPILPRAAREFAATMIARLRIRDLRPQQYTNAEVRAARAAEKATQAGDLATAAAEKRNQLVNVYAARAAYDAQDEVDAAVKYLRKFGNEGSRKGLDADYLDQIDALLDRFDLRVGQSLKAIDKRTALAAWIESQREQGIEPDIPPALLNEAFRKSHKDMTLEEFRGLVDSVKQIEHLGRLKKRLLTAVDQREYETVRDEIVATINANAQGRTAGTRTPTTGIGLTLQQLRRFWASHIKAATWARIFDGGDNGPVWNYIIRPANARADMETTMRAEATKRLHEIMAPVFKLGRMSGSGQFFATIGRSLNRQERIAIALNVGNEGNLQRLLGGEGWQMPQLVPVLKSLTAAEWQAVQQVWDYLETFRPLIAEKERRVYGKEPDWVEARAFDVTTADGQTLSLRGGYYPIKYDPAASMRAEEHTDAEGAQRQLRGAYTTATTRRSFTKARAEEVTGRPLLYNLSGMYSGVNDVIHDLAWHEWLIDANRLLRSQSIDAAIRNHYGPEAKAQLKSWVADVAEGDRGAANAGEAMLGRLRQGVSAAGLGFNVMSAAMQPLGFTQSMVRIGTRWVGRGIARYVAAPRAASRMVNEKSEFMRNRARTRFRELNELRNKVQDESAPMAAIKDGTFFLMMRAQQLVDIPTWIGAYEKAIADEQAEDRAVALANQAVIDAQGGGQLKDLSAIERGGPALKLFTVFYSFMNTALNLGVAQTMTPRSKARLAADYLLLFTVPAVLGHLLKEALQPGGADDDEDLVRELIASQLEYLMGLMVVVREFAAIGRLAAGAEGARDYQGPAGVRGIADALKFGQQALQGEFDDAFRKAAVNVIGDFTGLPSAQVNKTITGAQAYSEGETDNPLAFVFGYSAQ